MPSKKDILSNEFPEYDAISQFFMERSIEHYAEYGYKQHNWAKQLYLMAYDPEGYQTEIRNIGKKINNENGFIGMQSIYYAVGFSRIKNIHEFCCILSSLWDGVGQWKS